MNQHLFRIAALALALSAFGNPAVAADNGPVSITLPADHDSYKDGPHVDAAKNYCAICHAPDYLYMQPPLTAAQWKAEVVKMKTAYGCPVPDEEVQNLTDYLMSQNGKK